MSHMEKERVRIIVGREDTKERARAKVLQRVVGSVQVITFEINVHNCLGSKERDLEKVVEERREKEKCNGAAKEKDP